MNNPTITIIIPVYNAANLLERCLKSLAAQSYTLLELVFVNDCCTDHSELILIDFKHIMADTHPSVSVKIINHDVNKGVAAARNSGLVVATGDYIYYLDADDFMAENAIEILVDKALQTNADVVGCNWVLQFEKTGRHMSQPKPKTPEEAIEFMAKGVMRWNLWLFLVKKELYDDFEIRFLPGENMGEDMMVMFKILLYAQTIAMVQESLYYYAQTNGESLTNTYSDKHKQEVVNNLYELNNHSIIVNKIVNWDFLFNCLKLNIKLPLLISNYKKKYVEWNEWFPESNSSVLKNELISKRTMVLQFMASKRQYWFVKLHYYVVIKLIYGIIYK